ncbi:hypothetical protein KJ575_00210 [Patescibacteria group bacterium]|nr:hypothetical protein [Patescibacteria group bacterium]MBU4368129.1 hypothetical protein [Patescibacteria group bacterium]
MNNIFSSLFKYKPQPNITPEENFFTESLRFILTLDNKLCGSFVKFIGNGKEFVPPFEIKSQVQYGNSIIDLEITDKNGKKIFVEVKLKAQENRYFSEDGKEDFGQVEKYLRLNHGYVCFIAQEQNDVEIKTNKDKFLGQFEWFQIYEIVDNYIKTNKCDNLTSYFLNNFLNFMKELDMQPFQGFNKEDIKLSQTNFLDLYTKFLDFLRCVKKDQRIINFCKRNKFKIADPNFSEKWASFILRFKKSKKRSWSVIEIGFWYLTNPTDNLHKSGIYYYGGIWLPKEKIVKLRNGGKIFNLNKKYFSGPPFDSRNLVFKEIYFPEFIRQGEKKSADFIYESLLELEKKGVIKAIDETM